MSTNSILPLQALRGTSKCMWLYCDFQGGLAFARNAQEFRTLVRKPKCMALRVCVKDSGVEVPRGWQIVGAGLACDGIERTYEQARLPRRA